MNKISKHIGNVTSLLVLLTLFDFCNCFANVVNSKKTKHALIIAISNYPEGSGWDKLSPISSLNDAEIIQEALHKQGFRFQNIQLLSESNATKEGVISSLNQMINSPNIKQGDVVYIHVSSHGEQIEDDENGEELDGKDECIVTYGSISPDVKNVTFEEASNSYLRDDEFGDLIEKLRLKLGRDGDVLVVMDCCHSGTGTRGNTKVRGGVQPLVSNKFKHKEILDSITFYENSISKHKLEDLANCVVIAGARSNELNYECKGDENNTDYGSLTYAVCKAFYSNEKKNITYLELFSKIQAIMNQKAPSQHPCIEGDKLNRSLFGGDVIANEPFFNITGNENVGQFTINGGAMNNIHVGSKVAVYNPNSDFDDPKKVLSTGIVIESNAFSSVIKSDQSIKPNIDSWVVVTEQSYGDVNISLGFNGVSSTHENQIKESLSKNSFVNFNNNPDLILEQDLKSHGVAYSLRIANTGAIFKPELKLSFLNDSDMVELKVALDEFSRYMLIQKLESTNVKYKLKLEIFSYKNKVIDTTYSLNSVMVQDTIVLRVTNVGRRTCYLNVLDLQPDGIINCVLPNKSGDILAEDLLFEPTSTQMFPLIISPPYGTEIFKVFSSEMKLDLEKVVKSRGRERGDLSILEKYVTESFSQSRGANTPNLSVEQGFSIDTVVIEIKDRISLSKKE